MKKQPYYDKLNTKQLPAGDEMSIREFLAWLVGIGTFCGWLFYEFMVAV